MSTGLVLRRGLLVLATLAGSFLLVLAIGYMFQEAPRLAGARNDPDFVSATQMIAVGAFEAGLTVGIALAVGACKRSVWPALRTTAIIAWVLFPFNAVFTFTLF